ncbi:MAG: Multidrug resistance protein MdtB [bacterium ADurb.Bin157]|nr:MAG: Multidrug resistance protein MdtB [bacterium ADurb.Bin157]
MISFSVRRWVAIFCLMIAVTGLGLNSYRKLPLEELPKTDVPYITVITVYPGASPAEIETDVAKPVEDAISSVDGLKNLSSSCLENICQTFLEFQVGVNTDQAANDIRDKLDTIIRDFPDGVEKPIVLKYDINAQPVVSMAVAGTRPLDELFDYADNEFKDYFATVKGVAEVRLIGGAKREVQILCDRDKLAARGLTALDLVAAIKSEVKLIPAGRITQDGEEFPIKYDADYKTFAHLETLEIANKDKSRIALKDVAKVVLASEERRQAAFINKKPCVAVQIVKKADANAVEVVKSVREKFESLKYEVPGGVEPIWVSDMGSFIEASVDSAVNNIWQGILLTALLIFFFLYNLRTTLTVVVTMPLTVIAGVLFIYLMGYTLNTVTLLALGLSVGILITNSIVVLESIIQKINEGKSSAQSAVMGAQDVLAAVIASAGTNVVVLFPITIMKGIIGQFFIPFALAMVGITVISLVLSFTLTPAVAGQIIKKDNSQNKLLAKAEAFQNKYFDLCTERFIKLLDGIITRKWLSALVLCIAAILFVHSFYLVKQIGFTFLPINDRGEVIVKLEFPPFYSLENTVTRVAAVEDLISDVPHLKNRLTTVGKIDGSVGQTSEGVYLAQIVCRFSDKTERDSSITDLRDLINARLNGLPDVLITTSLPDQGGGGAEIKMIIRGSDLDTLDNIGEMLVKDTLNSSLVQDIDSSVRPKKKEIRVVPKRAVLSDLKVPATRLGMVLRTAIEGTKSGTYKQDARTYNIRVKLEEQEGIDKIARLDLPGPPGYPVILENFAEISQEEAPVMISRHNKGRVVFYYANPAFGAPLAKVAAELEKKVNGGNPLPAGYSVSFSGKIEAMNESIDDFVEVGIIAIILTYLLLAAILNSFAKPLIILLTIPLGLVGCVWSLYLTGESISVMVLLGAVMLVGIVVNNAILIMDRANLLTEQGKAPKEAMFDALRVEMRPVVMITLAAVFGMLPMGFDSSLGSELRTGIGLASIGGIIISAVLTVLLIPIIYSLFAKGKKQ